MITCSSIVFLGLGSLFFCLFFCSFDQRRKTLQTVQFSPNTNSEIQVFFESFLLEVEPRCYQACSRNVSDNFVTVFGFIFFQDLVYLRFQVRCFLLLGLGHVEFFVSSQFFGRKNQGNTRRKQINPTLRKEFID